MTQQLRIKKLLKLMKFQKSLIIDGFGKVNYQDTYKIQTVTNGNSIDKITTEVFKTVSD